MIKIIRIVGAKVKRSWVFLALLVCLCGAMQSIAVHAADGGAPGGSSTSTCNGGALCNTTGAAWRWYSTRPGTEYYKGYDRYEKIYLSIIFLNFRLRWDLLIKKRSHIILRFNSLDKLYRPN